MFFSYIGVIFHSFCVIPMYVCSMSVLSSALEVAVKDKFLVCVNILVIKLF